MASVKRIEGSTIHKIQSGQVIVDLCSAVKELVENAIDAGSTSIDIRFKNYGLDSIEVQDNGSGIAKDDFESIALKHYTSKLTTYNDLDGLKTYGFRGEALSSLCAVSDLHLTTARQDEAPQGTRLDFEFSGKLKSKTILACQRGTTELEKNIKREYTKVLNLLQAYACICVGIRLSVSNTAAKQRKDVFRTKGDRNTQDNIANVFGAKTLTGLIELDLKFDMKSSDGSILSETDSIVKVLGHVSAPVLGGGRPTSDRQMFYVNSRPCSLPQFAKVFNEVYKSYNMSQSPFVFANIILNTNAYDVNVSPDKRTIMLHDQNSMLDSVRSSLMELFENQQQYVPQATADRKLPSYKALSFSRQTMLNEPVVQSGKFSKVVDQGSDDEEDDIPTQRSVHSISEYATRSTRLRQESNTAPTGPTDKQRTILRLAEERQKASGFGEYDDVHDIPQNVELEDEDDVDNESRTESLNRAGRTSHVHAFNQRLAEIQARDQAARAGLVSKQAQESTGTAEDEILPPTQVTPVKDTLGALPNAFNRIRPIRMPVETATITIGDKTISTTIGSPQSGRTRTHPFRDVKKSSRTFSGSLRSFLAPGTQFSDESEKEENEETVEADRNDSVIGLARRSAITTSHSSNRNNETRNKLSAQADNNTTDLSDLEAHDGEEECLDEETKKVREDAKLSALIEEAEAQSVQVEQNISRVKNLLGDGNRESTVRLKLTVSPTLESIAKQFSAISYYQSERNTTTEDPAEKSSGINDPKAESHLSVTVSKSDFSRMRIVGQFNLGFIIAVRPRSSNTLQENHSYDEVFIIDQHASDEKYNFERLQSTTHLRTQNLVIPQTLDLTALEEEILSNNPAALQANGFQISIDSTGSLPVGRRCTLHALPTSREVTFTTSDLEELIALLSNSADNEDILPTASTISHEGKFIPRPSKVRKLFAMRACRSSIMIGKTLTMAQMETLVKNMGTIERPWNCPHGRPTMRHLRCLEGVENWLGQDDGEGEGEREEEGIDWEGWL